MRIHDEQIYLLAWTAGCLNAISFLGLGTVFSTNMTGNTVLLGIALAQGDYQEALRSGTAILGFCAGVFCGGLCMEWKHEPAIWTPRRIVVLALDALLLLLFAVIWLAVGAQPQPQISWLLLLFSTFAMGVQSALALALAFPGVATTYFTGTLTNLMAGLARMFHMTVHPRPDPVASEEVQKNERSLARLAIMWFVYALAAFVSSVLFKRVAPVAIFSPLATSLLVALDVLARQRWQGRH